MNAKDLAKSILFNVGGKENVDNVIHCATRLRFKLKDESKANTDLIKNIDGVMTVVKSGGQYQVVIGDQVAKVYDELIKLGNFSDNSVSDSTTKHDEKLSTRLVNIISGLFIPMLGLMAAAGILKGILVLLTTFNILTAKNGTYIILYAAADAFFYFLPIFVGFSAGKVFKVNQYISAALGAVLVYPSLVQAFSKGTHLSFLKIPVTLMNYTSSLVPVIFAVVALAYLDKLLVKIIPDSLKLIFVPLIELMIMVPLTLLIIGPLFTELSTLLSNISMAIYSFSPIVAGFFLAGFWQVAVLFGLHWALISIFINNVVVHGFDPINAMLYCTVFGQTGAALAVAIKTKISKQKEVATAATLSGFLGISEPIIYGVTLPRKRPFIAASIASAFGGAIAGFAGSKMYAFGGSGGLPGIPMFVDPKNGIDGGFIGFLISLVVAFGLALILTLVIDKDPEVETSNIQNISSTDDHSLSSNSVEIKEDDSVKSPVTGNVIPLSQVKDEVFSSEAMGKGVAIEPTDGHFTSPVNGIVKTVFPTGHAIGLMSDNGTEVLIHIGMDTVNLKGKGFKVNVKVNQHISIGTPLIDVNLKTVKDAGLSTISPVIITNTNEYKQIETTNQINVKNGDSIITVIANK